MPKTVRLLKVTLQATFVIDDGENLTEANSQTVTVGAADWPTFAAEGFDATIEALETQLAEQDAQSANGSANGKSEPAANRAARRAKKAK